MRRASYYKLARTLNGLMMEQWRGPEHVRERHVLHQIVGVLDNAFSDDDPNYNKEVFHLAVFGADPNERRSNG